MYTYALQPSAAEAGAAVASLHTQVLDFASVGRSFLSGALCLSRLLLLLLCSEVRKVDQVCDESGLDDDACNEDCNDCRGIGKSNSCTFPIAGLISLRFPEEAYKR